MKPRWARWTSLALGSLVALWVLSSFVTLSFLRRRSQPQHEEHPPAAWNGLCETLRLATTDGEQLGAWFVDASRARAPSVVLLHGRGGSRSSRVDAAEVFRRQGCAVLLVSLRAHGDSTGEREDFGWSARRDVVAAVDWVAARRPQSPVVVCGASLGGAAAVFAASELGGRVAGYVLECVYTDLGAAALRRCELHLPPGLDRLAYWGLRGAAAIVWRDWEHIAPRRHIARAPADARILLLAGGADRHAPLDDMRALHAEVSTRSRLVVIEGAAHDRLTAADSAAYERAVAEFLHDLD